MFEKILEQIDENALTKESVYFLNAHGIKLVSASKMKEIVQEESKNGGWIPCSERLPEAHKNVLVCENDGEIHLCRYNANMKRFFYDGSDWDIKLSEVIAWQPLPAPYQKGEGK